MLDLKKLVILEKEEFLSLPETVEKKERNGRGLKSALQLTDEKLDDYLYESYKKFMVEMIVELDHANMGDPRAQRIVGGTILKGHLVGVDVDKEQGIEYLELAAKQDDSAAAFELYGFYKESDPEKAKLYRDIYLGKGAER